MTKRSFGLLLLGIWIGTTGVAHAAFTANPTTVNIESPLGTSGQSATGTTTISSDVAAVVNFTLTGTGCGAFVIETDATDVTIGPGDNEIVRVRFTPGSTPGLRTCALEGRDGGAGPNADVTVQLQGTGLDFTVSPLTLTFGSVDVGASSNTQRVTATNHRSSSLTISSAGFTANGTHYLVTGEPGSQTLAAGASAQWDIACQPDSQGTVNGNFQIISNATVNGTQNVSLTCSGNLGLVVTSPTSHDFQAVVEGNTDQQNITLRNDGNAAITNLTATLSDQTRGYAFSAVPSTLAAGASTTVTVSFAPQDGQDGEPATITFSGSWGNPAKTTTAVLMLDGDGRGVDFSATPTLAFPDFRFDARPELTYQIRNAGDVDVRIETATFTPDLGTVAGEFLFTIRRQGNQTPVQLPQLLSPTDQLVVTVRAQPNARVGPIGGKILVESSTPATDDREVVISGTARSAALTTDPGTMMIDFDKVDIDAGALTQTLTLTNTGQAVLDIASITPMNVNSAFTIGTITPPPPTMLAVNESLTVSVTYDPALEKTPGDLDQGLLVVGLGGVLDVGGVVTQAMIPIQGRGIDRHIAVGSMATALPAFVGDEDGSFVDVVVRNTGEAPLQVMDMTVAPAEEWALINAQPFMVEGLSEVTVTVQFTPSGGGERTGELTLTTDDGDRKVELVGNALFVEGRGGGGCNTGGAGSGALVLGALAAMLALGRRRRHAALVVAIGAIAAVAPAAHAQQARQEPYDNVNVTVFEPTPATTGTGFQVQAPEVGASGSWVASSVVSHASDVFVAVVNGGSGEAARSTPALSRSTMLQLGAAFAFLDRFEVGAHIPLYMQDGEQVPQRMDPAATGSARGNLSVHGKVQLLRRGGVALGASASAGLPTASDQKLSGSDKVEGRLLLLGSFAVGAKLAVTVNAGPVLRGTAKYVNFEQRSGVAWGGGASYHVRNNLWLTGELFGKVTPSGLDPRTSPTDPRPTLSQIEWLAGLHVRPSRQFSIGLAAGRGVTDALGTPAVRGVLSLAFVPSAGTPAAVRTVEPGRPEVDSDGDGLVDSSDRCPDKPEDQDMFDDTDGCPDDDNDRDGIADARDKCPLDAEDKDGFQDSDGCSEKDNDGDGIADAQDRCRDEAEDKDGFQDVDGCSDPDNDRDGLADGSDKCPNEPETINAVADEDGCPDKGDTTVAISPDRIEMLDPIVFNGLKLAKTSMPVLTQVGALLRAHPEILRVRVTVHVHPSNNPDADQARSDKRAQLIRDWLIQFGIAPGRLEVRGFGGNKPLVTSDKRGAAKINERVELIILERK